MFLGIDIGTSGVKAVVISAEGNVAGQGTAALSVSRPHDLWSEQAPEDWWAATEAAVRAIDPAVRRSVRGVAEDYLVMPSGGALHTISGMDSARNL